MNPPPLNDDADLRVVLARVETKVDVVITNHARELADHEVRIRKLERWVWGAAGGAGVISAIGSRLLGGH